VKAYVPEVLMEHLGMARVWKVLNRPELLAYRNAILTKKIAAMALYEHAADWDVFLQRLDSNFADELCKLLSQGH
ncbi:MAG: hypothetical protein ACM3VW_01340, partial [Bacteroidota bacterium]